MAKLVLDIGHANGTGARGNGQEEHDLCSKVAYKLKPALEKKGHNVTIIDYPKFTNRDDLNKTISVANYMSNVDLGISLHMDASTNKNARGGHVCYISEKGKKIAEVVASHLCKYMQGRANKTVYRKDLAVLKRTRHPWILIELGFITSNLDIAKLMDNPATMKDELDPLIEVLVKGIDEAI